MPSLEEITGRAPVGNVTSVETPSGMKIAYCPDPRGYWINDVPVPSVTEVLQILHKPSLIFWGYRVGIEGLMSLLEYDFVRTVENDDGFQELYDGEHKLDLRRAEELLKHYKLTPNHRRDKAGDRGTSVHLALERWAETGTHPDPEQWPEGERGYVRGLVAFLEAVDIHPLKSELMVGSAKKGFAGRFDLLGHTEGKTVNPTPRKKRVIPDGTGIWDLKTGKGIYPDSHYLQLSAYRFAYEESYAHPKFGPARVDYEAIVNVREDGSWDVGISNRQPWQFLAVKTAWEALQ